MPELWSPLSLPVDDAIWTRRDRFDHAAVRLADRHYSREKVGTPQVGGPGFLLVFVTPDELAVWISKRHSPEATTARAMADGFLGYRCAMFRNETGQLGSPLIREAVAITERIWGPSPHGWMTYVDRSKIKSQNPGYCFKKAGWMLDREFEHPTLVRLTLPPDAKAAA